MDRCQHGQKIDRFCASQCCVWREGAGCSNVCMKKYHNHLGPSILVPEKQVQTLLKKYKVDNWVKPKVKTLEERIHNYFSFLKIELNNYVDEIDKKIRTELCYPYLSKNGIIGVYKKLKKRQYRKIQQKQFRQFYQQTTNLKPQQFANEQRELYEQQLNTNRNTLLQLFKSFSTLQDNLKSISIGVNFQLDKNYQQKIRSVFDSINLQKKNEIDDQIKQKFDDIAVGQRKQLSKQSLNNSLTQKWTSSKNTERKKSLEIINKDDSLPKYIQKKELKKSRQQLDQMKSDIVNLMSNKKDEQIIFDLTVTAPSQAARIKTLNSQISSRQNLDAKLLPSQVNKNYLTVDVKPIVSSSIQSLALSDKLSNKFKQKIQTNQITQVKHNQLPSQAGQNLGIGQKQRKKPSDLRLIVVPFKADKPLEPSQLSPLLQKRKKFFTDQTKQSDKKQEGFLLVPVKQQSPTKQQPVKSPVKTPENPVKPQRSPEEQRSIQLLTDAVQAKGEDAIPLLRHALKQAPNNLSAAQYLSYLLLQSGNIKQCLKICNDIQDQLQDQMIYQHSLFHINNNKAVALLLLGRYSQAIICLQKSLTDQQNPLTYKNLGDAYYSIGIYQKAVFYYQKSINLKPSGQTYYNLAVCLYIQQNFNNSLIMAELAVKHNPQIKEYSTLVKQIKNNL